MKVKGSVTQFFIIVCLLEIWRRIFRIFFNFNPFFLVKWGEGLECLEKEGEEGRCEKEGEEGRFEKQRRTIVVDINLLSPPE